MTIIESACTCKTCGQAIRPIRKCVVCGATLPKMRTDAVYCNNACRQKAHRQRHPKQAKQIAATGFSDNPIAAAGIPEADHKAMRVAALFERLKNGKTRSGRRNAKRRLIALGIDPHANGERT